MAVTSSLYQLLMVLFANEMEMSHFSVFTLIRHRIMFMHLFCPFVPLLEQVN